MNELTDKFRIKILKQVQKRLVSDLKEIKWIAKKHADFCQKNGYKRGRAIESIAEIVDGSFLYLDCRKADLEALLLDVPKDQMKLHGVVEDGI